MSCNQSYFNQKITRNDWLLPFSLTLTEDFIPVDKNVFNHIRSYVHKTVQISKCSNIFNVMLRHFVDSRRNRVELNSKVDGTISMDVVLLFLFLSWICVSPNGVCLLILCWLWISWYVSCLFLLLFKKLQC